MEVIDTWFDQYGYYLLLFGFCLDYVALPFPGQTVLIYSGYLSYNHVLHWLPAALLTFIGTTSGLTVTYITGYTVGAPLVQRWGKWLFLNETKMRKMAWWLDKHGKIFLLISCFFPGLRQFIGYFSGIVRLPFRTFAFFTFSGAFLWIGCFLFLGRVFAPSLYPLLSFIEKYAGLVLACLGGAIILYFSLRYSQHLIKKVAKER